MDITKFFSKQNTFIYSHESLGAVNALARGMSASGYRNLEAAIIDIENDLIHFFPEADLLEEKLSSYFEKFKIQKTLEDVAKAHCEFIAIHPFSNGNGRTARFIADINLASLGYTPFLNAKIDRPLYYAAMREYLKSRRADQMIQFFHESACKEKPVS